MAKNRYAPPKRQLLEEQFFFLLFVHARLTLFLGLAKEGQFPAALDRGFEKGLEALLWLEQADNLGFRVFISSSLPHRQFITSSSADRDFVENVPSKNIAFIGRYQAKEEAQRLSGPAF